MDKSILWIAVLLPAVLLDIWATCAIGRDSDLTRRQRWSQLVLVWLLPFVGPAIVLAIRHFTLRDKVRARGDSSLVVEDRHYIGKGYF